MNKQIIIFQTVDGKISIDVQIEDETVWLSLTQMAELFERDKSVISRHLNKIFKENELNKESTVANFATVQLEGEREVLQAHSQLTSLNLGNNAVGTDSSRNPDSTSTYALARAFKSWPYLQFLNLAGNFIGYEHPNSSTYFLEKLGDLAVNVSKNGRTLEVNLVDGIDEIVWTNESHNFQALTEQSIKKECEIELCTGKAIGSHSPMTLKPHISSTSRPTPFYQPLVNALKPWFSPKAWASYFDRKLDSVTNSIISYCKRNAHENPNMFPDRLNLNKSALQIDNFNHIQGLNYTFPSPMLTSGSQFLTLSK